jgi:hypothetical protein
VDERTFHSLPPLETLLSAEPGSLRELAMGFATPAQYLSSQFSLILLAYLDALPCGPNMGPNACTALGRRLVSVIHGTVQHSIMQRLIVSIEVCQTLGKSSSCSV